MLRLLETPGAEPAQLGGGISAACRSRVWQGVEVALCLGERPLCPAGGKGRARLGKRRSPRRNLD